MKKLIQVTFIALFGLAGFCAMTLLAAFIYGVIVMALWNWLVPVFIPTLPVAQHITYWQGWGLSFLLGILFRRGTTKE